MSQYSGSCHCGAVTFEIETDSLEPVRRCNCSICRRKNAMMTYVPETHLKITGGKDALTEYQFHTNTAQHYFCRHCGIYPFHRTRRFPDKFAINVGCLQGVDVFALRPELSDGAAFE